MRAMHVLPRSSVTVRLGSALSLQKPRFRQSKTCFLYDKVKGELGRLIQSVQQTDTRALQMSGLLSAPRTEKLSIPFTVYRVALVEERYLLLQSFVLGAIAPCRGELLRGRGN